MTCGDLRLPPWLFLHHFFYTVLVSHFDRFWCQLGSQDGPILAPSWAQNRSKIGHKMGQKLNHFFDCLFVQFVADVGLNLAPPTHPKWGSRPGAVHILQIWALCCFVAFWIDFWSILNGFWDLRWLQNAYKIDFKAISATVPRARSGV